jgi:hypothetical protein
VWVGLCARLRFRVWVGVYPRRSAKKSGVKPDPHSEGLAEESRVEPNPDETSCILDVRQEGTVRATAARSKFDTRSPPGESLRRVGRAMVSGMLSAFGNGGPRRGTAGVKRAELQDVRRRAQANDGQEGVKVKVRVESGGWRDHGPQDHGTTGRKDSGRRGRLTPRH